MIGGEIIADVAGKPKVFQINRAHLEDDAGMLKHFTDFAGIDYNRAGVALIEIVSEPCMFSAEDAVAYAVGMRAILQYLTFPIVIWKRAHCVLTPISPPA